jgi:two-component system response regulator FixJ
MRQDSDVVLVVDDDAAVRNALKFALELEGLKVRLYGGPAALLTDREHLKCRCLVIDYRMPLMDGLEVVERLRARGFGVPGS